MARVLARDVHITLPGKPHDPIVLRAGQAVPKEYAEFVTNPRAFIEVESEPSTPSAPASATTTENKQEVKAEEVKAEEVTVVNYSKLKKPELEALATERGLDATGTAKVLVERLVAADAAAAEAKASSDDNAGDEVDFDSMDEAALRAYAAEHGVDIADATSQEEIIALLENAQE